MSRRMAAMLLAAIVGGAGIGVPPPAAAHDRSASYSTWDLTGDGAVVTARLAALEATRLPWPPGDVAHLGDYLSTHLRLVAGDAPCPVSSPPRSLSAPPGELALEWRVACAPGGPRRLESDAFLDVAPSHLHFARVKLPDGRSAEHVLSDGERRFALDAPDAPSIVGAVRLGVVHILSGWDHLAFILALLLLGGTLADTARVVTGFTIAHSLTLALAVVGWVRPQQAPVEALIGLSIALVAAENCWLAGRRHSALPWGIAALLLALAGAAAAGAGSVPALALAGLALFTGCHMTRLVRADRPQRLRWHAAFGFGLLHGFGFASVLVDAGLPTAALARVLVGFNTGVELGQLAVVATVLPLVSRVRGWRPALLELGSAAVAGLGVFWFVTRAFG
jgi:HupE / UreJ protein